MTRTSSRRAGFTLVELMVAIVLVGIVLGSLINVIVRQQRFYRGATEVIDTRSQTRQAINLLPGDLRMLSSGLGDIIEMRDSVIDMYATVGTGVACRVGLQSVSLPPMNAARGQFTSWTSPPRIGDQIHIFVNDSGTFRTHRVISVDSNTVHCPGGTDPVIDGAADAGKQRYWIQFAPAPDAFIVVGAPVRITRRVRYSLYQSPTDRQWYLGYREQTADAAVLTAIQPVSGPYRAYAPDNTSGLAFFYFDGAGAPTTNRLQVARVDVAVRTRTNQRIQISGMMTDADGRRSHSDSLSIALRNRW